MPCLQASAHLAEQTVRAREAAAKQRPRHKRGREDNARWPAPPGTTTLRFLASLAPACDNPQSLLSPLDVSVGAGDSSAGGLESSLVSSAKSSLQFSSRNSTSTFTCTHQTLGVNPAAGKRPRQPFPLLTLASAQKAAAVGLLLQAATPPALAEGRRRAESSEQPSSDGPGRLQPAGQYSVPCQSPAAWPPAGAGPRWVGSAG